MAKQHSDLEVVENGAGLEVVPSDSNGLHTLGSDEGKHVVQVDQSGVYKSWGSQRYDNAEKEAMMPGDGQYIRGQGESSRRRRFCGIVWTRRLTYIVVAGVLLVVIAAAVGGGVGGALAYRNKTSSGSGASTSSVLAATVAATGISGPSTTTVSPTITTSTIVEPSATVYRDCPSSNNSVYSIEQSNAEPLLFRKICGLSYTGPTDQTAQVVVNAPVHSLDDCINLCVSANAKNQSQIASGKSFPCNSVCWRNGSPGDDFPFQCFGKYTLNSSTGFSTQVEEICDSAAWMNQVI